MDMFTPEGPVLPISDSDARLLVVEANRTAQQVLAKRLTRMGYRVSLSESGAEALDLLQARRYDLAIIDMALPGLSGLVTLREIRSQTLSAAMPVLLLTSRTDNGAAIEALEAGADDWMVKPFAFEVLGARIARLLDRARAFETLRRSNELLDARIAHRAIELGELRAELANARAQLQRMAVGSA